MSDRAKTTRAQKRIRKEFATLQSELSGLGTVVLNGLDSATLIAPSFAVHGAAITLTVLITDAYPFNAPEFTVSGAFGTYNVSAVKEHWDSSTRLRDLFPALLASTRVAENDPDFQAGRKYAGDENYILEPVHTASFTGAKVVASVSNPRYPQLVSEELIGCSSCGGGRGKFRCKRCKQAYYCSKECQKKDWHKHKHNCCRK